MVTPQCTIMLWRDPNTVLVRLHPDSSGDGVAFLWGMRELLNVRNTVLTARSGDNSGDHGDGDGDGDDLGSRDDGTRQDLDAPRAAAADAPVGIAEDESKTPSEL